MSPAPARRLVGMSTVTAQISMSLDGYVAGPEQTEQDPIGRGGMRLHEWFFKTEAWRRMHGLDGGERDVDAEVADGMLSGNGAYVMGRNMFGPIRGEWTGDWRGWWGDEPPYHTPVFVLTHHPRASLPMDGGTTFHFVTDGFDAALDRAREAAGDRNVAVAGGASTINQALAARALDELFVHHVPIVLGAGERLFDGVGDPELEILETIPSPAATHVRYRVAT
jgi:dihydrofolate reductase